MPMDKVVFANSGSLAYCLSPSPANHRHGGDCLGISHARQLVASNFKSPGQSISLSRFDARLPSGVVSIPWRLGSVCSLADGILRY